jgi:hypothetical protein
MQAILDDTAYWLLARFNEHPPKVQTGIMVVLVVLLVALLLVFFLLGVHYGVLTKSHPM